MYAYKPERIDGGYHSLPGYMVAICNAFALFANVMLVSWEEE